MEKLKCILLVDDDEITNFINEDLLAQLNIAEKIKVCENGLQAIDYLRSAYDPDNADATVPEIIFLDINMPVMNGFQFLEAYHKEFPDQEHRHLIFMLTTSRRTHDVDDAIDMNHLICDYLEKPLTKEMIRNIIKQHYDFYYSVDGPQGAS